MDLAPCYFFFFFATAERSGNSALTCAGVAVGLDAINVSTRFLPSNYPDNLKFIIKGVNHKLSKNDWETTLETVVIPKNEDENGALRVPYSTIKDIVTNKIIGQPTLESFGRTLSAIYGFASTTANLLGFGDTEDESGDFYVKLRKHIRGNEGFKTTAAWDIANWRIGFGTSTVALNGSLKGNNRLNSKNYITFTGDKTQWPISIDLDTGTQTFVKLSKSHVTQYASATLNNGVIWRIEKSTTEEFPPVTELARRARPHDCAF
jgi:hypothetical protein